MSGLTTAILDRLKELGWQQKRLAHEWRERVGDGSISTFETRLSKLLNDDQEGYDFVFGEARLKGLAAALEWTDEKLRGLIDAALQRLTLVLDPRLPRERRRFLIKRRELDPNAYRCVEVEASGSNGEIPRALKEAAKRSRNAIVVVANDRDRVFFDGAEIRTTLVEPASPGFRLVELPDLIPRLDPKLHDDDSMPMIPHPATENSYRERLSAAAETRGRPIAEHEVRWIDAIQEADAEGRPVTFRLDWLVKAWGSEPDSDELTKLVLDRAFFVVSSEKRDGERQLSTYVWLRDGTIFALGPRDSQRIEEIKLHHEVRRVVSFDPIVEALAKIMRTLNPNGEGGTFDIARELQAFEEETGFALEIQMVDVRTLLAPRAKTEFVNGASLCLSPESDQEVRALFDDILAREFVLPEEHSSAVFLLQAIRSAPLARIASGTSALSVLANVGAGRLIRFDAVTYSGEQRSTVRVVHGSWGRRGSTGTFDGGNVRFTLKALFDENLEGSVLRSVGRRRAEEAARADDYDD